MSHISHMSFRRGLAIVAIAVLVMVSPLAAQPPEPAPLRLLPDNTVAFVHVRVQDLGKSKAVQLLPTEEQKEMIRRLSFGVAPDLIETLTLASLDQDGGIVLDLLLGRLIGSRRGVNMHDYEKKRAFDDGKADVAPDETTGAAGPARMILVLTTNEALDPGDLLVMRPDKVFKHKGKAILRVHGLYFHLLNGRTLIASDELAPLERLFGKPAPARYQGLLASAMKRAATIRTTITVAWAYPEAAFDRMTESIAGMYDRAPMYGLFRTLGPLLKAGPAALAVDLNEGKIDAELHFADAAAARKGAAAARDGLVLLRLFGLGVMDESMMGRTDNLIEPTDVVQAALLKLLRTDLEAALRSARVEADGAKVQLVVRLPHGLDTLRMRAKAAAKTLLTDDKILTARPRAKSQNNLKESQNNLKQIVFALYTYHEAYKRFPPQAICDPDGKRLLSWRVAILPFIEEGELYREFRLDESWDSPHNRKLLAKMPKAYAPLGFKTKMPHATFYQGFAGRKAGFELRPQRGMFLNANALRIGDFRDGLSNTLLVAEAVEAVPWTKPADMPFDPKGPLPKVGGLFTPGFNGAFADGSVQFFALPLADDVLRALITRNGNEGIGRPK